MSYPPQSVGIRTRPTAPVPRLFDEVRGHMHVKSYSLRAEKIYIGWIRRFISANAKHRPRVLPEEWTLPKRPFATGSNGSIAVV